MRVRSLVSSTVTLIKHPEPKYPVIGTEQSKAKSEAEPELRPTPKIKRLRVRTFRKIGTLRIHTHIIGPRTSCAIYASAPEPPKPSSLADSNHSSGPGIQHTATCAKTGPEPEPEPEPEIRRERVPIFRKLDPWSSPSHPKHTTIRTLSSNIRTYTANPNIPDIKRASLDNSHRPYRDISDLGIEHPLASKVKAEDRMSDPTQNPSQLHGHATYIAGAAKEALGFASGTEDKEYAIKEMRAAKEQAEGDPAKNETVGKIEEKLGAATGCEGMVGEGKERQS